MAPRQQPSSRIVSETSTSDSGNRAPSHDGTLFRDGVLRPVFGIVLFLALLTASVAVQRLLLPRLLPLQAAPHTTLTLRDCIPITFLAAALSLITWVLAKCEHKRLLTYGLRAIHPFRNFFGGALAGVALLSALVLLLHQLDLVVFRGQVLFGPAAEWKLTFGWAVFYILAAFVEEFTARGYLQYTLTRGLASLLRRRFKSPVPPAFWMAALLLSCTVALLEQKEHGGPPLALLNLALFGLLMTFSLWRTGSLWWALGYHAAWDWAQSFLWGVPNVGTHARDHLFLTEPTGPALRSGGSTGPAGSIYTLGALAAGFGILMLLHRSRVYPELWKEARND